MKITASGLSVASGILTIPPTAAWYLDHTNVIHLPDNLGNWMLGIAVILFGIAMVANAVVHQGMGKLIGQQKQDAQTPSSTQASDSSPTFQKAAEFFKTFDNPVLIEVEGLFHVESDKYEPGTEREKYLIRTLASSAAMAAFEITYLNIFGSQLGR